MLSLIHFNNKYVEILFSITIKITKNLKSTNVQKY